MGLRDIVNKINPFRIVENIKQARQQKKLLKLCETNPEGVFDIINSGFGNERSLEDVLNAIVNLPNNEIEAILNPLLSKCNFNDTKRIIKYANKKGLNLDVDKITITRDINGKPDKEIEEYLYSRGGIDAYEFCKLFKPDKNNIEQFVEKDLRCIEFDIANNPTVYNDVIDSLIDEINNDIRKTNQTSDGNETRINIYKKIIYNLEKSKEIIYGRRQKQERKYYFPEFEMFKNIRKIVKRYEEMKHIENVSIVDLDDLNKPFEAFYKRDGYFSEEFGKKLQQIYLNDSTILGIHNTDGEDLKNMGNDDQFLKQFFDNGLCRLYDDKSVQGNVAIQGDYSLAELLYWIWDMGGKYNLVFDFPKSLLMSRDEYGVSKVIEITDGTYEKYIPSKYIVGAYERENPDTELIKNPNFNDGNVISKEELQNEN